MPPTDNKPVVKDTPAVQDARDAAREILAAFSTEVPEAWGAPTEDRTEFGFEWNFLDGSTLWFDIVEDGQFNVLWRKGTSGRVHHIKAALLPLPDTTAAVIAERKRIEAILRRRIDLWPAALKYVNVRTCAESLADECEDIFLAIRNGEPS